MIKLILLLVPVFIFAQSISSIEGTILHDESIVITGSSFGSKSPAAPIKFDDFDDGTDGQAVSTGGYWTVSGTGDIDYEIDNQRHTNSTNNVINRLVPGTNDGYMYANTWDNTKKKLFVSWWCKITMVSMDASDNWQLKLWRFSEGSAHADWPTWNHQTWWNTAGTSTSSDYCEWAGSDTWNGSGSLNVDVDKWMRFHSYIEESDQNTANGNVYVYNYLDDNSSGSSIGTNKETVGTAWPNYLQYVKFGYLITNNINAGHTAHTFWDDVYIDSTWARVEIGDNSVYANCKHREIQIPSAWAAGEITVTVNQGSFITDDTVYLFVIDADGTASSGYTLTVGGTPAGDPASSKKFGTPTIIKVEP